MTLRRNIALAVVGLFVAFVGIPVAASAAFAHDSLVASNPAQGDVVTSLTEIALTFSADPIDEDGADIVQVVGPDGRYYETACPSLAGPVVTTPVVLGPAGEYRIEWKIVSSDGHPVSDDYTFTYEPADGESSAAGAASPLCGKAAPVPDATSAPVASGDTDSGIWVGLGIGAAVIVVAAVGAWLLIRRRGEDESSSS